MAFLDKDEYLDALFDSEPLTDPGRRSAGVPMKQFVSEALATDEAVVVSSWRRPELSESSGTPTAGLEQSVDLVEVFCDCPPLVAIRRFEARRRHVRHDDQIRGNNDLLNQFTALASLGPIGVGSLVCVDTSTYVDVDAVTAAIELKMLDIRARYARLCRSAHRRIRPKPSTRRSRMAQIRTERSRRGSGRLQS